MSGSTPTAANRGRDGLRITTLSATRWLTDS